MWLKMITNIIIIITIVHILAFNLIQLYTCWKVCGFTITTLSPPSRKLSSATKMPTKSRKSPLLMRPPGWSPVQHRERLDTQRLVHQPSIPNIKGRYWSRWSWWRTTTQFLLYSCTQKTMYDSFSRIVQGGSSACAESLSFKVRVKPKETKYYSQ